ncbi:hypothetical protein AB0O31_10790 [Kitasatospora cineracea]|uniref:hypothetical protein n=1 Tax=Kitasatospora cineracea TaxID=88074 RepID=UPI003444A96F
MAVTVTVRLPAAPGVPARCDRHLAARTDEPARVRHLADVLHGEHPGGPDGSDESDEELWRRHPGCAVLALRGPDGLVRVRFRGGTLTLRPLPGPDPDPASDPEHSATDPAALAGSLVHALLSAAAPPQWWPHSGDPTTVTTQR